MLSSRRSPFALLTVAAAIVAAAVTAPGASAATQRYASPTGSGDCSSAKPCGFADAVKVAGAGDEVILAPGEYHVLTAVYVNEPITIHGVAGQPRPRLVIEPDVGELVLKASTLRYVEVEQKDAFDRVASASGAKLDQVILKGAYFAPDCALAIHNTTIRNSVVVARSDGSAICAGAFQSTNTSTIRNVTAVAGKGVAIEAYAHDLTASVFVNVINTIAKSDAVGAGLQVRSESLGAHATLTATHTNYLTYWKSGTDAVFSDGGGNQGTAPSFVNAAAGDYRQKAGSVTIDAGHYDPMNGAFDLDGDFRNVGSPDIGADEFVAAPTASTGPAAGVTDVAATLAGSVNSKGSPTSYHFEYGTTTAYGATTPATDAGSGLNAVAASASVSGLSPATTYHYRVVASNSAGVAQGGDQTFTTAPAGTSSAANPTNTTTTTNTTNPTNPTAGGFAGVKLVSTRLTLAGRFITVKLSCPAATAGRCTGRTKLTTRRRRTGSRSAATVTLGRAGFSIAAGKQARVKVRVSRAGRRLFAATRRLRGRAANAAQSGAGESKTTVAAVTIRKGTR